MRTPKAYQRDHLSRVYNDASSWGRLRAYMLSALIRSGLGYPTVHLAVELAHHRSVHFGPLVLEANLLNNQRLQ